MRNGRVTRGLLVSLVAASFGVAGFTLPSGTPALATRQANWPQPQRDAGRTSYNDAETRLTPSAVAEVVLLMKRRFHRDSVSAPMIAGGALIVTVRGPGGDDRLVRLSPDGTLTWGRRLPCLWEDPVVLRPVVVERSTDCSASDPSPPWALRVRNGQNRWPVPAPGDAGTCVLAAHGRILSVTGGGVYGDPWVLHATDPTSGEKLWSYGPFDASMGMGCPVVSEGTVFLTVADSMRAVGLDDGAERWALDGPGRNLQAIAASGDTVFLRYVSVVYPTAEFRLMAFDTRSRSALWDRAIPGFYFGAGVAVGDGKVFVVTSTSLVALDAATGAEAWEYVGRIGSAPTGAAGVVYVRDALAKGIVALDASDGTPMRVFPGYGIAVVADGRLYIGSSEGLLRVWG